MSVINNLSAHVTYNEAIHSQTATRLGIDNNIPAELLQNAIDTAENIYEPIRAHFGFAIYISSFYRCDALNKKVKGKKKSQHIMGEAIDLDCDVWGGCSNMELAKWVADNLEFDQMCIEGQRPDGTGGWIHISFRKGKNRKQILNIEFP